MKIELKLVLLSTATLELFSLKIRSLLMRVKFRPLSIEFHLFNNMRDGENETIITKTNLISNNRCYV